MKRLRKGIAIGAITLITTGCNQAPTKTDPIIRRDTANTESQAWVYKAQQLTTQSTFKTPSAHLDELIMIQNLVRESIQLYREARITGWENASLTELESQLQSVNKPLALESLNALDVAIDKSIVFKQKKTDGESLPVSDNSLAKMCALYISKSSIPI